MNCLRNEHPILHGIANAWTDNGFSECEGVGLMMGGSHMVPKLLVIALVVRGTSQLKVFVYMYINEDFLSKSLLALLCASVRKCEIL